MEACGAFVSPALGRSMMAIKEVVMTDRSRDQLPEHERRRETEVGGGITGEGGTAAEADTDRRTTGADLDEDRPQHTSDIGDPDPEDPNGPEAAYQPRSI